MQEPRNLDEILAGLYGEGRSARRQQASARARWFAELPVPDKGEALLELETLLEGVVFYPRALATGARRSMPPGEEDRGEELRAVLGALERAGDKAAHLLRQPRRRRSTPAPLDPVMLEGHEHVAQLARTPASPEEALRGLAQSLDAFADMVAAIALAPAVGARAFHATVSSVAREVARNPYFNPLNPVEVREEVDRLPGATARAALESLRSTAGRRVGARAFLLLARARAVLALAARHAEAGESPSLVPLLFAAFRHRARGAAAYFEDRAGDALAEGFEREILAVPSTSLDAATPALEAEGRALVDLRAALEGAAVNLRLETRLRGDDPAEELPRLRRAVEAVERRVERTLLGPAARRLSSEEAAGRDARLRRDAWMFAQVLRAFLAKAEAFTGDADSWAAAASQRFVTEFLDHFRALGRPLVWETDYPAGAALREALGTLRDTDLLDAGRMRAAAEACRDFRAHLRAVFDGLTDVPFDRHEAAETLKAYLVA